MAIPHLCRHAFYKGGECPNCLDDIVLLDMLGEAISRLLNSVDPFDLKSGYIDTVKFCDKAQKFADEWMEKMTKP